MVILKNEIKQVKKMTVIWAVILSLLIIMMLPVYINMVTAGNIPIDNITENAFFDSIGTSLEMLMTPMGMYSFLTFFMMTAFSIYGMNLGLGIMTKEYKQSSADFLMTKPYSRKTIYFSKMMAAALSIVVIGLLFLIASTVAMNLSIDTDFSLITLGMIALPMILIPLLFLFLGMLIGTVIPKLRTTIVTSTGVVFLSYACGSVSRIAMINMLRYLSPLHYFNSNQVIKENAYELNFIFVFILVCILLILAGYKIFNKKDIAVVS